MDPERFETVVRTLALTASRRRTLGGLLGVALVALAELDGEARRRRGRRRRQGGLQAQSRDEGRRSSTRATICHKPGTPAEKTLEIHVAAVVAHLGHGDRIGPCTDPPAPGCVEDAQCGPCQACVEAECRPANECGRCEENGIFGVCQSGNCLTDGSACAPPDSEA